MAQHHSVAELDERNTIDDLKSSIENFRFDPGLRGRIDPSIAFERQVMDVTSWHDTKALKNIIDGQTIPPVNVDLYNIYISATEYNDNSAYIEQLEDAALSGDWKRRHLAHILLAKYHFPRREMVFALQHMQESLRLIPEGDLSEKSSWARYTSWELLNSLYVLSLDSSALVESIQQRMKLAPLAKVAPTNSDLYYNITTLMSYFGEHEIALDLSSDFLSSTVGSTDRERAFANHAHARILRDSGKASASIPYFKAAIRLSETDSMKSVFTVQLAAAEAKAGLIPSAIARAGITPSDRENYATIDRGKQEILVEEAAYNGDFQTAFTILSHMKTEQAARLKTRITSASRAAKFAVSQDAAVIDARIAEETAKLDAERVERQLAEARADRARLVSFITIALLIISLIAAFYVFMQFRRERVWRIREQKTSAEIETLAIRAQGATRAKQQFISMMSHEIRTPLNHIIPTVQSYVAHTRNDPKGRIMCRIIDRASNRLLRMSDEIGMLSGGTDTMIYMPEEFAVTDILASIEAEKKKGYVLNDSLELDITISEDLPSHIAADPNKIGRVLVALLENSLKFGGHAKVGLHMSFEDAEPGEDHGYMSFAITDQGGGIPPKDMDRVMLPFTQKDMSMTRPADGMGVGLTLVSLFCRVMKADFSLDGQVLTDGRLGTRATVRMPAYRTNGTGTWKPAEESELRKSVRAQLAQAA